MDSNINKVNNINKLAEQLKEWDIVYLQELSKTADEALMTHYLIKGKLDDKHGRNVYKLLLASEIAISLKKL